MERAQLERLVCKLEKLETECGTFQLEKGTIGQGGTACVRAATIDGLTRKFAVKFLLRDISKRDCKDYLRFKQAYINLSSIQHLGCCVPLIMMGRYHCDEAEIPYVIMGRADSDLKRCLNGKKVDFELFEKVFEELAKLISKVHSEGVIHRDLKPENVFVMGRRMFLGDFDISKFDDAENVVLAETKPSDRLANYLFSAPEQSIPKIGEVCFASDWYAFAQIMIWIVKEQTIRGLTRISLSDTDSRYRKYEKLFTKLLQEDPKQRLQTWADINQFLVETSKEECGASVRRDWVKSLELFNEIVYKYANRSSYSQEAVVKITDRRQIDDVLGYLRDNTKQLDLLMVHDHGDWKVGSIKHVGDHAWAFEYEEISVKRLFVYKHGSSGGSIIIIQGEDMEGEFSHGGDDRYEEFARLRGKSISRSEYDAGWADIDGEKVRVEGAELVVRRLKADWYFISPAISPLSVRDNFEYVSDIGRAFSLLDDVSEEDVGSALKGKIKRSHEVIVWN